jgi:hypothetical protein
MKKLLNSVFLVALSAALAGCTLGGMGNVAKTVFNIKTPVVPVKPEPQVQVGNNLALPPDLQLAAPTQTSAGYQSNLGTGEGTAADMAIVEANKPAPPPAVAPAVFAEYGISLSDENGNPKSPERLIKELKAAKLARKKALNPNYGTIRNIKNIFKDQ